ncbi:MAG: adenosylhomocysteinase [candidate division Zixibacteria bacterium]|nr:adenosylhomocysteinase [candidate division Zixibacteria bacterium]
MEYEIKNIALADAGAVRIEWDARQMPVLQSIRARFEQEQPFRGMRIGVCLHISTKTANLLLTVKAGGADLTVCASNPLSTQDDVAASLVKHHDIPMFAIRGEDMETFGWHLHRVLSERPMLLMDDGADLVTTAHTDFRAQLGDIIGATEETTTGVIRLNSMARQGELTFPVVAVNESDTKHLFDNRYGTGQSALDGIIRATNVLIAGRTVVVCGYGWCGRGVASRARGLGADVVVTEVNPIQALEAVMEGYRVMPMADAVRIGDLFVTVTGNRGVIRGEHLSVMKDGVILANAGHFDVEIDLVALRALATGVRPMRPSVEEYPLPDGRRLYVLGQGRLVNLVAGEGHPAGVMDLSFANQALAAEYLTVHHNRLGPGVHRLPREIDEHIAHLKLHSMGIGYDRLTDDQTAYLNSWKG